MVNGVSDFALFAGVSAACLHAMEEHAVGRRFRIGEPFYRTGSPPDEVFAVQSGRLKVGRILENGSAVTLDVFTAGDIVGLVGALSEMVHGVTASCLSPVEALCWRSSFFLEWTKRDPVLAFNVNRLLSHRLRALADLVEELAPTSVEQRLARLLLRLAGDIGVQTGTAVRIDIAQRDLADLARTTVPTISRVIARWRQDDLALSQRGQVIILDPARLKQISRDPG